jgi:hypothetical protein
MEQASNKKKNTYIRVVGGHRYSSLSTIVSTTARSGNMKKELKNTISETVSTLRQLLVKLKDISESKPKPFLIWKRQLLR